MSVALSVMYVNVRRLVSNFMSNYKYINIAESLITLYRYI